MIYWPFAIGGAAIALAGLLMFATGVGWIGVTLNGKTMTMGDIADSNWRAALAREKEAK